MKLTPGIFGRAGMTRTVTTRATKVPKEVLGAVTKTKVTLGGHVTAPSSGEVH